MLTTILSLASKALPALGGAAAGAGRWLWTNRRWTLPVLLPALALVVLLSWLLWREHRRAVAAEQDLQVESQRQAREDTARRMGYPVAYVARRQAEVEAAAQRLAVENASLAAENKKADRELGEARTLLAAALRGKAAPVEGSPRPDRPGDEAKPVALRAGDELALGADLQLRQGVTAGEVVILGNLFADRRLDGVRLATQAYDHAATWATLPHRECPSAERRDLRIGAAGGGQAGPGGVGWLAGGQLLYRSRWTLTGAGGPAGGVALAGWIF